MKNYGKLIAQIFIGAVLMAMPLQSTMAFTSAAHNLSVEDSVKDKFVGGWGYTVAGAPEGYEEGFLLIVEDGDSYKVQIQTGGGTMLAQNVKTKGSTIMFDLTVEGEKVAVSLTVDGGNISGTSTSSQGTYNISGTKTLSPE